MKKNIKIQYLNNGDFKVQGAERLDYDYFPLTNGYALKGSISHNYNGDLKLDQNHFLLAPSSELDLKNSPLGRNVFFNLNGNVYSLSGNTPLDRLENVNVDVEAGFLYYGISKEIVKDSASLKIKTTTFAPLGEENVEVSKVNVKLSSKEEISLKVLVSIPLYSRSADSIRDHRHVTSLLNKAKIVKNGIINTPTMLFDEKSHLHGEESYAVFVNSDVLKVSKYLPTIDSIANEGTTLAYPSAILDDNPKGSKVGDTISGEEIVGGFLFKEIKVSGEVEFDLYFAIYNFSKELDYTKLRYRHISKETFDLDLANTKNYWLEKLSVLEFNFADKKYNSWLKWVSLQPILRRIYGCSFLPHHDYGKGGRGWRDLWQDCLALLYMEPKEVEDLLFNNFIGERIDGSNATIIGDKRGEFKADRNAITRVWSDHGAWPFVTVEKYVNMSGNKDFLLKKQVYFKDKFSHYTKNVNLEVEGSSYVLKRDGSVYEGSILEHLIIQNVVPFYNVGKHGYLRLENADWNDGLDMAVNGESIAFTSLYGSNLISLGKMIKDLNVEDIYLIKELSVLLNNLDFEVKTKKRLLKKYFDSVKTDVSGNLVKHNSKELANKLINFGKAYLKLVKNNAFLENKERNLGYFAGYYDNEEKLLENVDNAEITLTGQVFALMGKAASESQINRVIKSVDELLYKKESGGYLLNSDFKEVKFSMGRAFGFGYGHKENGAMFSHMAVMYSNGLYVNDRVNEGNKVLRSIYDASSDINKSMIYPGIPEYIAPSGRGMYHYLTGSASWYILTLIEEVMGIKRVYGDLLLAPKLLKDDFNKNDECSLKTLINGKVINIVYVNKNRKDTLECNIKEVYINGELIKCTIKDSTCLIKLAKYEDVKEIKVILE